MPGKVKVRVLAGRNLPVMDRSSDTTDAYVEVKLGSTTYKTDVFRKSLNPQWNSEWFIFEVDDLELQDEPLQIRIMDHDTYSANDAIGKVYVDLNPLLLVPAQPSQTRGSQEPPNSTGAGVMSGWLPVYDTMHGIRGEVNILVKVDLFSDFNKFRQSSCGVQFFFTPEIPAGFRCNSIIGFVEELVVNDDPEYQWIDKIRTPRASNEARQTLFSKLSGELQRRIGLKVLEQGGNAVIGYRQCFDLEGESGIVVRGIGSVVSLARISFDGTGVGTTHSPSPLREFGNSEGTNQRDLMDPTAEHSRSGLSPSTVSPKRGSRSRKTSGSYPMSRSPQMQEGAENAMASQSPTHSVKIASPSHTSGAFFNRRSSDSDLSITPKGGSLTGSGGSSGGRVGIQGTLGSSQKPLMSQESFDNLIYPFLTMKSFPPEFIIHLGGTVSARSVKLLDRGHLPEEMDSRDSWWAQLRTEIRSHARSIACNVVLGYEEFTTICDEVCVLNATGTAAVINVSYQEVENVVGISSKGLRDPLSFSLEKKDLEMASSKVSAKDPQVCLRLKASSPRPLKRLIQQQNTVCRSHPNVIEDVGEGSGSVTSGVIKLSAHPSAPSSYSPCILCHIPYMENANPFNVKILKCAVCRKGKVPDVLLTTLELPATIPVTGQGCLIQARVVRSKKDLKGELNAKEISDSLPFLEYELHKQLYQKIMMKGMNSLFGLRVRVTVGEKLVVGVGTGTAVYLSALPPPPMPRVVISGTGPEEEKRRVEMQKKIQETFEKNKEMFGLKWNENNVDIARPLCESKSSDTEDSEEELLEFDLSSGNKDAYVLDLDDLEDVEMLNLLLEGCPPPHLISISTQTPPGFPLEQTVNNLQMFTRVWRGKVSSSPSRTLFSSYFEILLQSIYFKIRNLSPCILSGLKVDVELPEQDEIQISVLGMVLGQGQPPHMQSSNNQSGIQRPLDINIERRRSKQDDGELMFAMEEEREAEEKLPFQPLKAPSFITHSCNVISNALHRSTSSTQSFPSVPSVASISSGSSSGRSSFKIRAERRGERPPVAYHLPPKSDHFGVEITPLSFIPGARIERHLGNLNFFFIRESTSIKENGGLSAFIGSFVTEVLALVRAHVAAIGGNAMISYFLSQCVLLHNPHKNQGQCLINVGGDIVQVTYCTTSNQPQDQTESNQQVTTNAAEPINCATGVISE